MGLFISCEEATIICTKNQYKEASFKEKIKLNLHVIRCKLCGLFSKQNAKLSKVCEVHLEKAKCDYTLSENDKEKLKQKLSETK